MRTKKSKFVVAVLTFSLGLGVFYLWHIEILMPQEEKSEVVFEAFQPPKQESSDAFDPWKMPDNFPPLKEGEFSPVYHGCGNGYVDGWLAYDDSHLVEGFNNINRKDFDEIVASGTTIQRVENYPNKYHKKGLRLVLHGISKKTGEDYYSILWFDKWHKNETGMYYIDAPNLEIALELEQKLIKDSQKNSKK